MTGTISAQDFNFGQIHKKASSYTVSVEIVIEVSYGTQTTEAKNRGIGTIVSADGLVMFDGTPIDSEDPFSVMSGMSVSAEPTSVEVVMMDETRYPAEFIGIDRYTKLGFCRITADNKKTFDYVTFKKRTKFKIGEWLGVFMILPEFVSPNLGADIGLVSATVNEPEEFVLTVGFNELELASVLYDTSGTPVGVLGSLNNPALSGFDASGMLESFSQMGDFIPLLGIIDADRINKLIKDPPRKGKPDRGWLGIHLQALTGDIADFWDIDAEGGIIVNDVVSGSPADSAGINTGDIIVELSGMPIEVNKEENIPVFQKRISELGAGTDVYLVVLRRQEGSVDSVEINVTLGEAPLSPAEASDYEDENFEMKIRDMVFADYNLYHLDRNEFKGVVVKEVESGGWSSVGGVQPGDIVQSIGGQTVTSVEEARKALEKVAKDQPEEVVFFLWRNNKTLFVNIKTDW
jgi:serine protease Do